MAEILPEFIVDLRSKVEPAKLATLLGINVSLVYQESQKGRLPPTPFEVNYLEAVQMYLTHFKKSVDVKLEKEKNEQELRLKKEEEKAKNKNNKSIKSLDNENDVSLTKLQALKLLQGIRIDKANEEKIYLDVQIKRENYIDQAELYALIEPFLSTIRDMLLAILDQFPESNTLITSSMQMLESIGLKLIKDANKDTEEYIHHMLSKEIDIKDYQEILDSIKDERNEAE